MHYITIGLLATIIMDQFWIPMPTGLHILANVICFAATAAAYSCLEEIWEEIKDKIRRANR